MEKFLIVILSSLVVLGIFSWFASKYNWSFSKKGSNLPDEQDETDENQEDNSKCCGQHLVCQKDKWLMTQTDIVYYDDEELDAYRNISPDKYDGQALDLFSEVFYTLKPEEMMGWLNSLRLREIELPLELRDEALMIVSERRNEEQ